MPKNWNKTFHWDIGSKETTEKKLNKEKLKIWKVRGQKHKVHSVNKVCLVGLFLKQALRVFVSVLRLQYNNKSS